MGCVAGPSTLPHRSSICLRAGGRGGGPGLNAVYLDGEPCYGAPVATTPSQKRSRKRTPGGSTPPGDLRRGLLAAAEELLASGGAEAVTLRAVARRAGVSPGAPYHHFENKEALLAAVGAEGFRQLRDVLDEALFGIEPPGDRLERMVTTYVRFATEHAAHYGFMFPAGGAMEDLQLSEVAESAFQRLSLTIAAMHPDAGPDEVVADTTLVWSLCHGLVRLRIDGLIDDDTMFPAFDELVARAAAGARAMVERHLSPSRLEELGEGKEPARRKKTPSRRRD
jgi:AcrR family transcriptional regulator